MKALFHIRHRLESCRPPEPSLRICFLGIQNVDPDRSTSLGVVIEAPEEKRILLDPGPYVVQGLKKIALTPDDLHVVFASHDHADHCGGFPAFLMTWLLDSAKMPESFTWAVPHAKLSMLQYARSAYPLLFNGSLPRRVDVTAETVRLDETTLKWVPLDHTVETWGSVVTTGATSFAYLPDSTATGLRAQSDTLAGVANVVMSVWGPESSAEIAQRFKFPTAEQAGRLLKEWGSRQVFVQHLATESEADAVTAEIGRHFDGKVIIPRVGEWYELS